MTTRKHPHAERPEHDEDTGHHHGPAEAATSGDTVGHGSGHGAHGARGGGHGKHEGHHVEMFRRRFWVSLLLSIPVVVTSHMVVDWFGYDLDFGGVEWVGPVLG